MMQGLKLKEENVKLNLRLIVLNRKRGLKS